MFEQNKLSGQKKCAVSATEEKISSIVSKKPRTSQMESTILTNVCCNAGQEGVNDVLVKTALVLKSLLKKSVEETKI